MRVPVRSVTRPRAGTQPVIPFGLAGSRTRYQVGRQCRVTRSASASSTCRVW